MSVEKTFRGVFDRTCQRLLQMVMATELPSNGNSDQNQPKLDVMADTIKGSPKASTPNERQTSRALRSKSSRQNSNCISKNDLEDLNRHGKEKEQSSKPVDSSELHDNHKPDTHSQVAHLRQLLLLHLELIQQQQEKLQKRDRELNQLKIEKEQLESRIHRMERRMAVKKRRGDLINNDYETPSATIEKPTAPKRRLSTEQMIRSKRVPATASVVISSHTNNDVSFDSNIRTEFLYLHSNQTQSTTNEQPKQSSNIKEVKFDGLKEEEKGEKTSNIVVPCWKVSDVLPSPASHRGGRSSSSSRATAVPSADPLENIDDEAFSKRHCKQEAEEKRRKRSAV